MFVIVVFVWLYEQHAVSNRCIFVGVVYGCERVRAEICFVPRSYVPLMVALIFLCLCTDGHVTVAAWLA